ncbi:isoprenylcysteine carboxyl methyltransferase family protein [Sutcliffiella deserti]|uniref:isoprenylcysteine carboxyl methyltransferase family protein n=1 Tax=Sutcliffiella deserti TaxID=2875501 RepID=UPI001CBEBBAD|nr:isoprenylcysteine carboxylmethyltransferase family protein [Sutcliffiella deserti]
MFTVFYLFIVMQRLGELRIARKNEKWMKDQGALEFGSSHYTYMLLLHTSFLMSFLLEVLIFNKEISPVWSSILLLFIATQLLRIWAIRSLGKYWNTKILIVPDAVVIQKGPYRFLRHPNYFIVGLEIILIPILFQAYVTALIFTVLNMWMLSIRIPIEEAALSETTKNYSDYIQEKSRFRPKLNKNIE